MNDDTTGTIPFPRTARPVNDDTTSAIPSPRTVRPVNDNAMGAIPSPHTAHPMNDDTAGAIPSPRTVRPVGATHASPLQLPTQQPRPKRGSLGAVVGSFKSACTKRINEIRGTAGEPLWQRNYYEHIIRTAAALDSIRHYIADNPAAWAADEYNPARLKERR
jgi:hypothetical protein